MLIITSICLGYYKKKLEVYNITMAIAIKMRIKNVIEE
jgi:hypothetical protein